MKQALALLFALALTLPAHGQDDKPTTMRDLTAIGRIDSGVIGEGVKAEYTREKVEDFLDQFVGIWEGSYVISTMQGQSQVTMTASAQYFWELVGETRVLKNQTVYATGEQLSHSNSLTYFWRGRLVSEVEQDNKKQIYFGLISPEGNSVHWTVANAKSHTTTGTKETFTTNDQGEHVIEISGYEELRQGDQFAYLQLKGELVQGVLE